MKLQRVRFPLRALVPLMAALCLWACGTQVQSAPSASSAKQAPAQGYLVSVIDEPDTTDFQCTTIHYTVALNVFNRLVETQVGTGGTQSIVPSLAESWDVSDDGLTYTFRLRDDVEFSNGSPLTTSDVKYTFERLLTHPDSCNQSIMENVRGAQDLQEGRASELAGFVTIDDHEFQLVLDKPFSAFLPCLCMPSASILDEQSTEEAGERFGKDPASTIGTGPFVFAEWTPHDRIRLDTNPNAWEGVPSMAGVELRFVYDADELSKLFENGELDILNVDDLGDLGDYFLHGDTYASQVHTVHHVGIDYIALNESVEPLGDLRVRKALQLALNRQTMLDAVYSGDGRIEDGILPEGLMGHNPNLEPIPYDLEEAKKLLDEAGYADGFDLEVSMRSTSPRWQGQLLDIATSMWADVGVRATVHILEEDEFMSRRTSGDLACYTASWAADFDDPDNFVYTFFGTSQNSRYRSLCYDDEETMARVRAARSITDEDERMEEYHNIERAIVQEDAAWIPLFSRDRHFLVSDRVTDFTTAWNGWFETSFKYMGIRDA